MHQVQPEWESTVGMVLRFHEWHEQQILLPGHVAMLHDLMEVQNVRSEVK